jgi:hypothetical protein
MRLWDFVIADEIKVLKHAKKEIHHLLRKIKNLPETLFSRKTWERMHAFVRIIPHNDILPSRSKYSIESNDWQVALNYLTAGSDDSRDALWYSLPDVVASVLLTKRISRIVDAFRIRPHGVFEKVKRRIQLRGAIRIDPQKEDFFKVIIEQRQRLRSRTDLSDIERDRLNKALKVLANATSYGIYAQMDRHESEKKEKVTCYGIDPTPFSCRVIHPEEPGEYCFQPLASLITGAARLMLALLEHSVSSLGGTYAMEDTDSMAIVSTQHGELVPCTGGTHRLKDGQEAIRALSWNQVDGISKRFSTLNPYKPEAVPGSILKIEGDNFDPVTQKRRQIYCLAISAKRYALFTKDRRGIPTLLRASRNNKEDRWSEHGLGHLLNPTDPESEDRDWISMAWLNITRRSLGLPTDGLEFKQLPAIGRTSVSSPAVMEPLMWLNNGKKYGDQIKPQICTVDLELT